MENRADNFDANLSKLVRFFERTKAGYAFATIQTQGQIQPINQQLCSKLNNKKIQLEVVNFERNSELSLLEQLKQKLVKKNSALVVNNFTELLFAFNGEQQAKTDDAVIELNFSRENLHELNTPILFWLTNDFVSVIGNKAADLYSQRSISTVYFDVIPNEDSNKRGLGTFFEPKFRKTKNAQEAELKVKLLQKQLQDAENKKHSFVDIANRLALPLAKTYSKLNLHTKSLNLINKYKDYINKKNLQILLTLAKILKKANKLDEAIYLYEEAIALAKDENNIKEEALSKFYIASIYHEKGQNEDALNYFIEYYLHFKQLYDENPNNESIKYSLAISYSKVGDIYQELEQTNKAIRFFEQEASLFEELYKSNPKSENIKNGLAIAYSKLGYANQLKGDFNKAIHFTELDIKLTKELREVNPNSESIKNTLAISYERLGDVYQASGQFEKALHFFKMRTQLAEELNSIHPEDKKFTEGLAISNYKLAMIYKELNDEKNGQMHFTEWKKKISILNDKAPKSQKYDEWNDLKY